MSEMHVEKAARGGRGNRRLRCCVMERRQRRYATCVSVGLEVS